MKDVMSGGPRNITANFVDSKGETTGSILITPSTDGPREFNETEWSREQVLGQFHRFLKARDDDGLEASMRALDRLGSWHEALEQLRAHPLSKESLGGALLSFWISYGFHIARSLNGDLILVDAFRDLLPPYAGGALRLYRGELAARHERKIYGISWTPDLAVARMFASRRFPDEGRGIVLEIDATPAMIITGPGEHTAYLGETEYLVDPRMIGEEVRAIE